MGRRRRPGGNFEQPAAVGPGHQQAASTTYQQVVLGHAKPDPNQRLGRLGLRNGPDLDLRAPDQSGHHEGGAEEPEASRGNSQT